PPTSTTAHPIAILAPVLIPVPFANESSSEDIRAVDVRDRPRGGQETPPPIAPGPATRYDGRSADAGRRPLGTDLARRTEPQGARGAGGRAPAGHGQGGSPARRHRAPPVAHEPAGRGDGGPGRDQRPDRRHRRRALRGQRPREAARVGERDRHPGEGALMSFPDRGAAAQRRHEGRTVGLVSLGCPKNLVDSEVMLGRLRDRGYSLVAEPRQADVIVVNTCAFIDRAKQESIDTILQMPRETEASRAP